MMIFGGARKISPAASPSPLRLINLLQKEATQRFPLHPDRPSRAKDPELALSDPGVNGWHAHTGDVGDLLNREESDPAMLMQQRAGLEEQIHALAGHRDAGRPARVQDTRGDGWATTWRGRNDWYV